MPKRKKDYKNMEKYSEYVKRNRKKNYEKGREGSKRHIWTEEEIGMIMDKNGMTDREIALKIGHSVLAIQTKRSQVKRSKLRAAT